MDSEMKRWIDENIKAGYTPQQLRQALTDNGQDPHLVDEYLSYSSPLAQIPEKRKSKDVSNVFALVFALCSVVLMFASAFLAWFEYQTPAGTDIISGVSTPFGKALLFVSASSLVLVAGSRFLNRKFSIGEIALSVFAVGIVLIAMITQSGGASVTTGFNVSAKFAVESVYGAYIAMLTSVMSLLGGVMLLVKHD